MSVPRGRIGFNQQIDKWVIAAIERGATSFQEILVLLPGVFPTDLIRSLSRLRASGGIGALPSTTMTLPPSKSYVSELPVPHVLDYDWRFTGDTADLLVDRAIEGLTEADHLVFLGTPTCALNAANRKVGQKLSLLEANSAAAEAVRKKQSVSVYESNALALAPRELSGDVVVLDPPWYRDYIHSFLAVAAALSVAGGRVLMAVPPVGTRAEAAGEHAKLERFSSILGLRVVKKEPGILRYVTPPYEINALIACGLTNIPRAWRRGDLWTLKKMARAESAAAGVPVEKPWSEAAALGIRFKIRAGIADSQSGIDPRLISFVEGDICPAVSRNHPLRARSQVWTSCNRVFGCAVPEAFAIVVQSVERSVDPVSLVEKSVGDLSVIERRHIEEAAAQVERVVAVERQEIIGWGHSYLGTQVGAPDGIHLAAG